MRDESGTENIFEATLMVFRGLQRTWPAAIQLKILNFLRVFFARTELLVLAGVNFSSSPTISSGFENLVTPGL